MAEVTGPIIATTAVLMAVFVPVAFIPGVTGRLYNQFALTVAISVGISAFNSLTLSPALERRLPAPSRPPRLRAVPLVQRRLRLAVARLCAAACAALIRLRWADAGAVRRRPRRDLSASRPRIPVDLPAGRGPGLFLRRHPAAGRRLAASAPTRSPSRCARSCSATPGVEIVGSISGLNFLTSAAQSNSAVEFAILKPWDERGAGPERLATSSPRCAPKLLAIPEALRAELRSAVDPGPRRDRRLRIPGRGSDRARQRRRSTMRRRRCSPRRASSPSSTRSSCSRTFSTSTPQFNYDLDRNKAKLLGPQPARCVQHAADLSRLALRERLQPVRPHLPRDACRPTRTRAPRPTDLVAALCAQRAGRHGAAQHARHAEADRRARRPCRTTTTTARR